MTSYSHDALIYFIVNVSIQFTAVKSYIKKYFCIHQMNRKFNLKKDKLEFENDKS